MHTVYIAADNPVAAMVLKEEIEQRVAELRRHPRIYKPGRVDETREMVVRHNYIVVYKEDDLTVTVLRVLHAARSWP
ncbi:type II toxin-antitoxin system RelE/ParE family toxin [Desulfovibrio sp. OttesenSCG-928-G11]|nr:type II toxin-antitoxin system RelE/ParE family toxin [Desulfovibrio sp. OttesenSCG-928-G11]